MEASGDSNRWLLDDLASVNKSRDGWPRIERVRLTEAEQVITFSEILVSAAVDRQLFLFVGGYCRSFYCFDLRQSHRFLLQHTFSQAEL